MIRTLEFIIIFALGMALGFFTTGLILQVAL